jgi:hypothetical protein
VVSAATGRAIEAFEYGVRFAPKPFGRERLESALQRVLTPSVRAERPIEHLGVRRNGAIAFVRVGDIAYIRGAGTRSELVRANGTTALHDKMLDRLEGVLPEHFERIHKSYIVDMRRIARSWRARACATAWSCVTGPRCRSDAHEWRCGHASGDGPRTPRMSFRWRSIRLAIGSRYRRSRLRGLTSLVRGYAGVGKWVLASLPLKRGRPEGQLWVS